MTDLGDPFNPVSRGVHRTDSGTRYLIDELDGPGDGDILVGRDLDVNGLCFVWGTPDGRLFPNWLVELNLQHQVWDPKTVQPTGQDMLPAMLERRGMTRAASLADGPPLDVVPRWTIRLRAGRTKPSGIYAPGRDGRPGGWVVLHPLTPTLRAWHQTLPRTGGKAGVYLTTHTWGLINKQGADFVDGMEAEAAAGRLFVAPAVVLP